MRLILSAIFFNLCLFVFLIFSDRSGFVFLSVGQGDAALKFDKDYAFLVDAGPKGEATRGVSRILGRRKYLDIVFISHSDKDHWGGFPEVSRRYKIGAVVFPADSSSRPEIEKMPSELFESLVVAEKNGSRLIALRSGDSINFGSESLIVLSPDNAPSLKGNNNRSLVFSFVSPQNKFLFVGDIGRTTEKYLIKKYGRELDTDILKVSHHGSKSSSGADFLSLASPEAAVISVGKNSYGHPSPEVITRLIEAGSEVFRTDFSGDIFFRSDNAGSDCLFGARACLLRDRMVQLTL